MTERQIAFSWLFGQQQTKLEALVFEPHEPARKLEFSVFRVSGRPSMEIEAGSEATGPRIAPCTHPSRAGPALVNGGSWQSASPGNWATVS
jgi:hypothetical protein